MCFAVFAAQGQTRILPMGDSTTSSFAGHNSFRRPLWFLLQDAGFSVDFVGSQNGVDIANSTPPDPDFDMNHEGHPGWTSADGANFAGDIAAAQQPDVVMLDLGANDPSNGILPEETTANLQMIIEDFRAVNPDVTIVLALPPPSVGDDKHDMSALKKAIQAAAKNEKSAGAHVIVVNLGGGFSASKDTFDGAHPNESGEAKLAKRYFKALRKVL